MQITWRRVIIYNQEVNILWINHSSTVVSVNNKESMEIPIYSLTTPFFHVSICYKWYLLLNAGDTIWSNRHGPSYLAQLVTRSTAHAAVV